MYLNSINFAAITDIEGVDDEQEDDIFKNGLACVSKDKGYNEKLGAGNEKQFVGDDFKNLKGDDNYNSGDYNVYYLVKLVYCCLCII